METSDESGLKTIQAGFLHGDIDNDGDQDIFAGLDIPIVGESHRILLNDGNGRFEVLSGSGVEGAPPFAAAALFADFNNDGKLTCSLVMVTPATRLRMDFSSVMGPDVSRPIAIFKIGQPAIEWSGRLRLR